jgi:hypothetical protein
MAVVDISALTSPTEPRTSPIESLLSPPWRMGLRSMAFLQECCSRSAKRYLARAVCGDGSAWAEYEKRRTINILYLPRSVQAECVRIGRSYYDEGVKSFEKLISRASAGAVLSEERNRPRDTRPHVKFRLAYDVQPFGGSEVLALKLHSHDSILDTRREISQLEASRMRSLPIASDRIRVGENGAIYAPPPAFTLEDSHLGKYVSRARSEIFQLTVKARILYDYLELVGAVLPSSAFMRLILRNQAPASLVRSSELNKLVGFDRFLLKTTPSLSKSERVTLIHAYENSADPISHFHQAQAAFQDRVRRRTQEGGEKSQPVSAQRSETSRTPLADRRKEIRAWLLERQYELGDEAINLYARCIDSLAQKTGESPAGLRSLIAASNNPVEVVQALRMNADLVRLRSSEVPKGAVESGALAKEPGRMERTTAFRSSMEQAGLAGPIPFSRVFDCLKRFDVTLDGANDMNGPATLVRPRTDGKDLRYEVSHKVRVGKRPIPNEVLISLLDELHISFEDFFGELSKRT